MKRRILWASLILLLTGISVAGWFAFSYHQFLNTPIKAGADGSILLIEPGSSMRRVAAQLEAEGLIGNARYFSVLARLGKKAQLIQAGEFLIEPGLLPEQLLDKIVNGKVMQHSLTLVEGWDFRQMVEAVNRHEALKHTLHDLSAETIMVRLGHAGEHPEGRFFPDTYHFPRGLTDIEFLQRAYNAMTERLAHEWENKSDGLPLKTPYEALILASIVEKETGLVSERQAIAGVFIRRLQRGMRLQTDPTVIYGLGPAFDGNIRRSDLTTDTPYNTYTRHGLPPTPIAMPGADAIHAALHPDDSKALYFVAKGDGSHYFSATLEEHNNAVIKYQLKGKKRPFSSSN